ncbi:virulence RhuM family protein [Planctomycetota bacterium]
MGDITPGNDSQIIIYQTESGQTKIEVRLEDETVWLTQKLMAGLFQTSKQNIGQHIKNILAEKELEEDSVVKDFFTTAADGKKYKTKFYCLDAIISVGYRVQSHVATRFRQWATGHIREYIVKGFVLDDERLKNPDVPFDYFDELLRRIQDIRTSDQFLVRHWTFIGCSGYTQNSSSRKDEASSPYH